MMRYRLLGKTGLELSIISFGGSGYGKVYGHYDKKAAITGLEYGLDRGINYIDTAPWYGQGLSECFLGKALRGIDRTKYYIGTKVGRYERKIPLMFNFSGKKITESIEESLRRLNLDYVDLLQIHDIEFAPSIELLIEETLPALEKIRNRGLCRYIGITGYPLSNLKQVVKETKVNIDTILSYCRLSLNDSSLVHDFDFYKSRNIGIINASPMSMGLLAPEIIQDWHPAGDEIKLVCSEAVQYCRENQVDISRIAINYSTSFEEVTTTLVSMTDESMVKSNCDAILHPLSVKEIEVKKYVEKLFKTLKSQHWEGKEVKEYWDTLKI